MEIVKALSQDELIHYCNVGMVVSVNYEKLIISDSYNSGLLLLDELSMEGIKKLFMSADASFYVPIKDQKYLSFKFKEAEVGDHVRKQLKQKGKLFLVLKKWVFNDKKGYSLTFTSKCIV